MSINSVKLNANLSKNYTTHTIPLLRAIQNTCCDIVEVGSGPYSTPLLHWICKDLGRKLITYENDIEYYNYARMYTSPTHKIVFVKNWDDIKTDGQYGVVFIDHHPPERRAIEIMRFKDSAGFIVIHDTERDNAQYNMVSTFKHFKYVYTWKGCKPWTSIVSNKKNIPEWT